MANIHLSSSPAGTAGPLRVFRIDWKIIVAIVLSVSTALIQIYAASLISSVDNPEQMLIPLLAVTVAALVSGYAMISLGNYIAMTSDVRMRKLLSKLHDVPSSRANNDVNLAVGAIASYVNAPARIVSIAIYAAYLFATRPSLLMWTAAAATALAYPLYRYAGWRRTRISVIRSARNRLLDSHQHRGAAYDDLIDHYGQVYRRFWRIDVLIGAIAMILIAASTVLVVLTADNSNAGLATLLIYVLLVGQLRYLFLSFSVFQENRRSMVAIENTLNGGDTTR